MTIDLDTVAYRVQLRRVSKELAPFVRRIRRFLARNRRERAARIIARAFRRSTTNTSSISVISISSTEDPPSPLSYSIITIEGEESMNPTSPVRPVSKNARSPAASPSKSSKIECHYMLNRMVRADGIFANKDKKHEIEIRTKGPYFFFKGCIEAKVRYFFLNAVG